MFQKCISYRLQCLVQKWSSYNLIFYYRYMLVCDRNMENIYLVKPIEYAKQRKRNISKMILQEVNYSSFVSFTNKGTSWRRNLFFLNLQCAYFLIMVSVQYTLFQNAPMQSNPKFDKTNSRISIRRNPNESITYSGFRHSIRKADQLQTDERAAINKSFLQFRTGVL